MNTKWVKFEDLNVLLNRSLQRSNDAMLREEGGTTYTIGEITMDLPVFTKLVDVPGGTGSLYIRFPHQQDETGPESGHETDIPLTRIKLTLKPTVSFNNGLE